jgi:ABC-type dipeptide/oligopeptide/nickel transport system permease subunit
MACPVNGVSESNPHIVLVRGASLFLTVLSMNLTERVRRKWDPRQAKL